MLTTQALAGKTPAAERRLSKDVTPTHYDLTIKTDLDSLTFEGQAEIELDINADTSSITFHALAPLKVHEAVLISTSLKTTSQQSHDKLEVHKDLERVTASFKISLPAGSKAKLGLKFTGELDMSMSGYYRSAYSDEKRAKAFYALTQFEPCAARRAFPCWDEPAIKATFGLTMISKAHTVSLANMNVVDEKATSGDLPALLGSAISAEAGKGPAAEGEWKVTKFATTPKMSTYLVAWANGEFAKLSSSFKSPKTGQTIPLTIYATEDNISQGQLALDTKAQIVPIYEKIFDIAYPLPKLDTLVASDFDAGAMENWGLITGRTSVYLCEDGSSVAAKKRTAGVQSHEVAHQWFGNVVTMEWWDNLWLNEAFATLMGEIIIINEIYPEWRVHSSFINEHLKRALQLDSLRSSHPIEVDCPTESHINQIFDAISYSKGASVLKMLANMIGEKPFLKGVSIYLKKHLYSNSRTKDLWAGISEASGIDVAKLMANWTLKVGFPVITVGEQKDSIKVTQNRFLSTGDATSEEDQTLWHIPLEIKTVGKDGKATIDHSAVLTDREKTFPVPDTANAVFKLNAETAGVYRVRYSPERLAKLGEEAAKEGSVFTLNDRMGLVQDAFALAKSGYGSTSGALNLISKLKAEEEMLVWTEISGAIADINSTWWEQPKEVRDAVSAFRRDLFGPIAKRLGFDTKESDNSETRELRTLAISAAANAEDPETIKEIQRRFGKLVESNDESLIPADLRTTIFMGGVKHGGDKEYQKVLEVYKSPRTPQHKTAAMSAFTAPRDQERLKKTFGLLLTDFKEQDLMYAFAGLAANPESRRGIWQFLQSNFDELIKRFSGNFSLSRLVQYSIDSLTSDKDIQNIEAFFKDKDTTAFNLSLMQGLDSIRSRTGWLSRDAEDVQKWLQENRYSN